jgi:hypothetical protein
MPEFHPALPKIIKWSVGNNRFDQDGKFPKSLSVFVPLESVEAFGRYLAAEATNPEKIRKGKVWDYSLNAEVEVEGIYLNAKGKAGNDGAFGNINPAATTNDVEPAF